MIGSAPPPFAGECGGGGGAAPGAGGGGGGRGPGATGRAAAAAGGGGVGRRRPSPRGPPGQEGREREVGIPSHLWCAFIFAQRCGGGDRRLAGLWFGLNSLVAWFAGVTGPSGPRPPAGAAAARGTGASPLHGAGAWHRAVGESSFLWSPARHRAMVGGGGFDSKAPCGSVDSSGAPTRLHLAYQTVRRRSGGLQCQW